MTVRQLREMLAGFPDDLPVVVLDHEADSHNDVVGVELAKTRKTFIGWSSPLLEVAEDVVEVLR